MKFLIFLAIVSAYFLGFFLLPLRQLLPDLAENASYIFDLSFILVFILFVNFKPLGKLIPLKKLLFSSIPIIIISSCYLAYLVMNDIRTPFHFIQPIGLHLLVLSPIAEELLFRHIFFEYFPWKYNKNKYFQLAGIFTLTIIYSTHYLLANYFFTPEVFQAFGFVQLFFVSLLGFLLTYYRWKYQSILLPIMLHFVFNLSLFLTNFFELLPK